MRHGFHSHQMCRVRPGRDDVETAGSGRGPRGRGHGFGHGHGRGFGPGRGEGGEGHRRRRGKMDAEELRLLLLSLLSDEPRHGYDLIRAIEALTGGIYAPSPGVVYPALSLLRDMALVEDLESEGTRKVSALTEEGRAELAEKADLVQALTERLKALASDGARVDVTPVRRAMDNLRTVLKNRLTREDATKEMVHDIADRLDALAREVERQG